MNPNVLTVYQCPYPKLRIGKNNDGGYIIVNIPDIKYDIIISGGISDDITFETDFVNKYGVECVAFDGTIQRLPAEGQEDISAKTIQKKASASRERARSRLRGMQVLRLNICLRHKHQRRLEGRTR